MQTLTDLLTTIIKAQQKVVFWYRGENNKLISTVQWIVGYTTIENGKDTLLHLVAADGDEQTIETATKNYGISYIRFSLLTKEPYGFAIVPDSILEEKEA